MGNGSPDHRSSITGNIAASGVAGKSIAIGHGAQAHVHYHDLPYRLSWKRPQEFDATRQWKPLFPRRDVVQHLHQALSTAEHLNQPLVSVYGGAGTGKSMLATLYVQQYGVEHEGSYPGGVLWVECGRNFNPQNHVPLILKRWAGYAYGDDGQLLQQLEWQQFKFTASQVCGLLSNHGRMLAVFDNVWQHKEIDSLKNALPATATILITTRDSDLAHTYIPFEMPLLKSNESLAFLNSKLADVSEENLENLANQLGNNIQALDIIASSLANRGFEWKQKRIQELLTDPDTQREYLVSLHGSLQFSYNDLGTIEQARFRTLGIVAALELETSFVAALWEITSDEALETLEQLRVISLITETTKRNWLLNKVVHDFAHDLLAEDPHEAHDAEARYRTKVVSFLNDSTSWNELLEVLPHMYAVADQLVENLQVLVSFDQTLDYAHLPTIDRTITEQEYHLLREIINYAIAFAQTTVAHPEFAGTDGTLLAGGIVAAHHLNDTEKLTVTLYFFHQWFLGQNRYDEAIRPLQYAISLVQELENISDEAWIRLGIASCWRIIGNTDQAIEQYQQVEHLIEKQSPGEEERALRLSLLMQQCELYVRINQAQQAFKYLEQALSLVEDTDNPAMHYYLVQQIAQVLLQVGETDQVREMLDSDDVAGFVRDNPLLQADLLNHRAMACLQIGLLDQAAQFLDEAIAIAKEYRNMRLVAGLFYTQALVLLQKGELQAALRGFEQTLETLGEIQDKNLRARTLCNKGLTLNQMGQATQALEMLHQALPLLQDLRDTTTVVQVLDTMGKIYQVTGKTQEGITFFQEWAEIVSHMETVSAEITARLWWAILLQSQGENEQALEQFRSIEDKLEQPSNPLERATSFTLAGQSYYQLGQLRDSIRMGERALALWDQMSYLDQQLNILVVLIRLYLEANDQEEAYPYLDRMKELVQKSDSPINQVGYANLRGVIEMYQGKTQEAQELFNQAAAIVNDLDVPELRIVSKNNIAVLQIMQGQYDLAEQSLKEILKIAVEADMPSYISLITSNLGIIEFFSHKDTTKGIHLFDEAITLLHTHDLKVDAAGQSVELLQEFKEFLCTYSEHGEEQLPLSEVLEMLLRSTNWHMAELIVSTNLELFQQQGIGASLGREIQQARDDDQPFLAEALSVYKRILEWVREDGVAVAFRKARQQLETEGIVFWWAMLQRSSRNYDAALLNLNRALDRKPEQGQFFLERGWVYRGLGNYAMARTDFEKATRYIQREYRHLVEQAKGIWAFEKGDTGTALTHLSESLRLVKDDPGTYQWRGSVYYVLGDHPAACKDLDQAIQLEANISDHYYWRALCLLSSGEYEKALEDLDRIIEIDYQDQARQGYDYLWRAITHHLKGNLKQEHEDRYKAKACFQRTGQSNNGKVSYPEQSGLALHALIEENLSLAKERYQTILTNRSNYHLIVTQCIHLAQIASLFPQQPQFADCKNWLVEMGFPHF
jgi:tetratricopeptide (TPR) repeat protein